MITEDVWKHIYNAVFSIYLPPNDLIEKIIYEKDGERIEFKTVIELVSYLTLNSDKSILQKDVNFVLKQNDLYEENKNFYDYLIDEIKKTS